MKQAAIYAMGIVTGCAALVLADRFAPRAEATPTPFPTMAMAQDAGGGTLIAVSGSMENQREDVLWLIYKRPSTEEEAKLVGEPRDQVTILAYRLPQGGKNVEIPLCAARNAYADLLLPTYVPELKGVSLDVKQVADRLREEIANKK